MTFSLASNKPLVAPVPARAPAPYPCSCPAPPLTSTPPPLPASPHSPLPLPAPALPSPPLTLPLRSPSLTPPPPPTPGVHSPYQGPESIHLTWSTSQEQLQNIELVARTKALISCEAGFRGPKPSPFHLSLGQRVQAPELQALQWVRESRLQSPNSRCQALRFTFTVCQRLQPSLPSPPLVTHKAPSLRLCSSGLTFSALHTVTSGPASKTSVSPIQCAQVPGHTCPRPHVARLQAPGPRPHRFTCTVVGVSPQQRGSGRAPGSRPTVSGKVHVRSGSDSRLQVSAQQRANRRETKSAQFPVSFKARDSRFPAFHFTSAASCLGPSSLAPDRRRSNAVSSPAQPPPSGSPSLAPAQPSRNPPESKLKSKKSETRSKLSLKTFGQKPLYAQPRPSPASQPSSAQPSSHPPA